MNSKRILFFDGVCVLCNGVVDFALPKFKEGEIYFSPLQGLTAKQLLTPQDLGLDYVVYYRNGTIHRKSQAVAYLLGDIGGIYRAPSIMLHILPNFIADAVYRLVAKYRYRIFGQAETCRRPSPQEKKFFVD